MFASWGILCTDYFTCVAYIFTSAFDRTNDNIPKPPTYRSNMSWSSLANSPHAHDMPIQSTQTAPHMKYHVSPEDVPLQHFSPSMPIPLIWDPEHRLKRLKEALNPNCLHYCSIEGMRPNLLAVIKAYEDKIMPSRGIVYFKNGQMINENEAKVRDSCVWVEVRSF